MKNPNPKRPPRLVRLINQEMGPIMDRIQEPGFRVSLVAELANLYIVLGIGGLDESGAKWGTQPPPRATIDRWFSPSSRRNPDRTLPSMERWPVIKQAAARIPKPGYLKRRYGFAKMS